MDRFRPPRARSTANQGGQLQGEFAGDSYDECVDEQPSLTEQRVLLVPGTLMSAKSYDAVRAHADLRADGLDADGVEWMLDVPHCDIPRAADCVAERIRSGTGPAILVGHSTGGTIAAVTALNHPELVSGLVLINSGPNMIGHGAVDQILQTLRESPTDEVWERFALKNVAPGAPRRWIDDMIEFSRRAGAATAASILRSQAQLDLLASGQSSDLVVEVLHGRLDEKRTPADAEEWEHVFPKAAVTVIDDCGHSPHLEAPSQVVAAVRRVVGTLQRTGV
ncbi:alpha/beta hydrolase [Brevibacterium sp. S111]|nr:alpha/beta hydrolase [Brevibacterium sp. S111]